MSIPTDQLFFEKISHYDRPQEPVTFGIPFPRGALSRAEQFALYDGRAQVYCQKSVTGSWDDGSIRWLLVYCLLDLPGGSGKSFRFAIKDDAHDQPAPSAVLTVVDREREVVLDTGPLQLSVGKPGADLIRSVTLHGERLWDEVSWPAFSVIDEQGTAFSTAGDDTAQVEIKEQGPLRAALRISGTHRHRVDGFLDYVVRIHAWAGKPYVLKGMRTLESILINMNFQLVVSPGGKKTVVNGPSSRRPCHSSGRSELRHHNRTVDSLPGGGR